MLTQPPLTFALVRPVRLDAVVIDHHLRLFNVLRWRTRHARRADDGRRCGRVHLLPVLLRMRVILQLSIAGERLGARVAARGHFRRLADGGGRRLLLERRLRDRLQFGDLALEVVPA